MVSFLLWTGVFAGSCRVATMFCSARSRSGALLSRFLLRWCGFVSVCSWVASLWIDWVLLVFANWDANHETDSCGLSVAECVCLDGLCPKLAAVSLMCVCLSCVCCLVMCGLRESLLVFDFRRVFLRIWNSDSRLFSLSSVMINLIVQFLLFLFVFLMYSCFFLLRPELGRSGLYVFIRRFCGTRFRVSRFCSPAWCVPCDLQFPRVVSQSWLSRSAF